MSGIIALKTFTKTFNSSNITTGILNKLYKLQFDRVNTS